MGLKDIGATLPPGFRFNPSDEELLCHYLNKKIASEEGLNGSLMEIDLHTCEPWQLPEMAKLNASEWYFFSFRDRKYATGYRTNRATTCGYWKATGKDRTVHDPFTSEVVGMRKTLVFYLNRAPNGIKTCWIMHEFRLESHHAPPKEDWVLCRVFYKSKQGENDTSSTSPINKSPPNTFQNNIKPNVTCSSPPNKNPNNINISIPTPLQTLNRTFHEHNLVFPSEFQQPQIINMPPLTPNSSVFRLFALETNIVRTPISIGAMHDHISDIYNKDYDELKFSWDVKEDEKYDMDIVSTLEDHLGFGLEDNDIDIIYSTYKTS